MTPFLYRRSVALFFLATLALTHAFVGPTRASVSRSTLFAASTQESFKKADFVAAVAEKTGLNKKESEEAMQAVLEVIQEAIGKNKKVTLAGFGTFTMKERAARKGRNPQTGEEMQISASKSPGFSPAKAWKDEINGKKLK
jgi:DNA-binding protein HU-beta